MLCKMQFRNKFTAYWIEINSVINKDMVMSFNSIVLMKTMPMDLIMSRSPMGQAFKGNNIINTMLAWGQLLGLGTPIQLKIHVFLMFMIHLRMLRIFKHTKELAYP